MSRAIFRNPLVAAAQWHHFNGEGMIVGRLAAQISKLLQGKHRPTYNPAVDQPEYVVVTNVEKVVFSGKKEKAKLYRWHSGYPGALHEVTPQTMRERTPEQILKRAVSGMLPKNRLRDNRMSRLKLFFGDRHMHQAQLVHEMPLPEDISKGLKLQGVDERKDKDSWVVLFEETDDKLLISPAPIKEKVARTYDKPPVTGKRTWKQIEQEFETRVGPPRQ